MYFDLETLASVIAVLISIVALYVSLKITAQENAPFLLSLEAKLCFNHFNKQLSLTEDFLSNGQQFILDYRSFRKADGSLTDAMPSLILDSRPYSSNKTVPPIPWVAFTELKIYNAGFDLIKFEITSIQIFYRGNTPPPCTLMANPHNAFYLYLKSGDSTPLYLTYLFDKGDHALLRPDYVTEDATVKNAEKLDKIKSNIYNTVIPVIMDNYEKMIYFITTTNKFGKKYTQTLTFSIKNNMYFVENSVPKAKR